MITKCKAITFNSLKYNTLLHDSDFTALGVAGSISFSLATS